MYYPDIRVSARRETIKSKIIKLLQGGANRMRAAHEAGSHYDTMLRWMQLDDKFKQDVENAEQDFDDIYLNISLNKCKSVLLQSLDDPDPAIRLKAAMWGLERKGGWVRPDKPVKPAAAEAPGDAIKRPEDMTDAELEEAMMRILSGAKPPS